MPNSSDLANVSEELFAEALQAAQAAQAAQALSELCLKLFHSPL